MDGELDSKGNAEEGESRVCAGTNKSSNVEVNSLVFPEEKDAERFRGDAIGSTLYSESGLLKTLINLSKVTIQ